jgi:hypothetical protein
MAAAVFDQTVIEIDAGRVGWARAPPRLTFLS